MPPEQHVRTLLAKAAEDELALDALLAARAPEASVGFHAQQAAEKLIKAAIKLAGAEYPLTHNIRLLLEVAEDAGLAVPSLAWGALGLTPFAVRFRHEALPEDARTSFRGAEARQLIRDLRAWVEGLVGAAG